MGTRVHSSSPERTLAVGARIGKTLQGKEIVLLRGELGAGKTLLAKGIASGIGIDPDEVVSPTFTLMNRHRGRFTLYHIDLYRLGERSAGSLPEIDDHIDAGIIVVEWAQYLDALYFALENAVDIGLHILGETERAIEIASRLDYIAFLG